jgi:hypothetical protein
MLALTSFGGFRKTAEISAVIAFFAMSAETRVARSETPTISGGTRAGVCALPDVLCLGSAGCRCTATLVHPRVIIYAAHCGPAMSFRLGESSGGGGMVLTASMAMVNPDYGAKADPNDDVDVDWAFSVLDQPVALPVTPVAYGCELDQLMRPGQAVVQVGFGQPGSGTKYYRPNSIAALSSPTCPDCAADGVIQVGKGGVACPGDSGGPLLAQMPDMSWRTIGIASTIVPDTVPNQCGSPDTWNDYSRVRRPMVEWIERSSGIDITPCFDLDGTWNPMAECTGFFAGQLASGSGTWADACQGTPSVASRICAAGDGGPLGTGGAAGGAGGRDAGTDGAGVATGGNGGGGSNATGGNGGSAGTATATSGATTGTTTAGGGADNGSCGCHLVGAERDSSRGLAALLVAGLAVAARRRKRGASACFRIP